MAYITSSLCSVPLGMNWVKCLALKMKVAEGLGQPWLQMDWANPLMRRNRDGKIHSRGAKPRVSVLKIHYESRKAHPQSTTSGKISPRMGNKFTTSGEATSGEFVTHEWGYLATSGGIGDVTWVMNRGLTPSLFLLYRGLAFQYSESENALISLKSQT